MRQDEPHREWTAMADTNELKTTIENLQREKVELSGMMLATGIILTQLLQAQCKRELNPQAAAGRIMQSARDGIEGFSATTQADPRLKQRALDAVQQYEDQIRSVLAV
jgi:hypothetical protein